MNLPHDDLPLYREAVAVTQNATGFAPRLIEKDYFCTLVLQALFREQSQLVFKGGTCLAKVHAGFYRLSEDIDLCVAVAPEVTRSQRSRSAEEVRKVLDLLPSNVPVFNVDAALKGANNSTQYNAVIGYDSPLSGDHDTIKVEIGLREVLLDRPVQGQAQTLLVNPISRKRSVPPFPVACLSFAESFAEKLRAALTRRDAAIRDYYDIDFAVRTLGLRLEDKTFVDLARLKLSVSRTPPPDTSDERLQALRRQLKSQLRPVLRPDDFAAFDLDRAYAIVGDAERLLR